MMNNENADLIWLGGRVFGILGLCMLGGIIWGLSVVEARTGNSKPTDSEFAILFVLEGVGKSSVQNDLMPTLTKLTQEGSVTWRAVNHTPGLRLPSMASIVTGLPMEKHGITWDRLDFARGFPRPPTLFDYMDLSGGKDAAIFYMDESLYQLAKPEIYTDYQICGPLRPECDTDLIVRYVRDYLKKAPEGGHNHWILSNPHLLVVHLPEAGRVGQAQGWDSEEFRQALKQIDGAIKSILGMYRQSKMLDTTTVFVTALSVEGNGAGTNGTSVSHVPWIAWGFGIKPGHQIQKTVSLMDTGATVMQAFGLHTYTEWESHSIQEVFITPPPSTAEVLRK